MTHFLLPEGSEVLRLVKFMKKCIITISRNYGAGAGEIGRRLSADLNIPFYDKEILHLASKSSGLAPEVLEANDERPGGKMLYRIIKSLRPPINDTDSDDPFVSDEKTFRYESAIIKQLAEEQSCVIIGRCADYLLKDRSDTARIFIHASQEFRLQRMSCLLQLPNHEVLKILKKTDRVRQAYYNYFTGAEWHNALNYDLTIDTEVLSIEKSVQLIKDYLTLRGFLE